MEGWCRSLGEKGEREEGSAWCNRITRDAESDKTVLGRWRSNKNNSVEEVAGSDWRGFTGIRWRSKTRRGRAVSVSWWSGTRDGSSVIICSFTMAAIEGRTPLVPSLLVPCYPESRPLRVAYKKSPRVPLHLVCNCLRLSFLLLFSAVATSVATLPIRVDRHSLPLSNLRVKRISISWYARVQWHIHVGASLQLDFPLCCNFRVFTNKMSFCIPMCVSSFEDFVDQLYSNFLCHSQL